MFSIALADQATGKKNVMGKNLKAFAFLAWF